MTVTDAPAVLTVAQVAHALNCSRWLIYDAVRRDDIPALRLGTTIRIPASWLERTLAALEATPVQ